MKFTVLREDLLRPLQTVSGVVERRQTLPVLSNILFKIQGGKATLTATDLEVELVASLELDADEDLSFTVPARKLLDICKALPDGSQIQLQVSGEDRVTVSAGRSRFTLSTLPVSDFPVVEEIGDKNRYAISQRELKRLIDKSSFSMAQQDVRYYLNGLLMEFRERGFRAVASDGHRLAVCDDRDSGNKGSVDRQVIIPRKGVVELGRLLDSADTEIQIQLGDNHIRVGTEQFLFTSKLVDGKYPDYERVLPAVTTKRVTVDREELRSALQRTAILSNEKYRGVRWELDKGVLKIQAQNPELEEAEEEVSVNYDGDSLVIGFNVNYLVEALNAIEEDNVELGLTDQNSSCILKGVGADHSRYVVMPMHL